jgi:hypothetical protein
VLFLIGAADIKKIALHSASLRPKREACVIAHKFGTAAKGTSAIFKRGPATMERGSTPASNENRCGTEYASGTNSH